MMLGYADLVHPAAGVERFEVVRIDARPVIVVPDPGRRGPQAGAETDRLIKLLAASLLAVMGHLQVIAVQIVPVRSGEHLVAAFDARVARGKRPTCRGPKPG